MTTLAYVGGTTTFSDDLLWTDEFAWLPAEQRREYTIAGGLLVDASTRNAGRPITLVGGDNYGWVTRTVLLALYAAASLPAQVFTLTLRGVAHSVLFAGVEARPVIECSDPEAADFYIATLRFIKV